MPTDHRATLAKIRRFDQLVAYLRDEMGWPIANGEDFEDLTFEYTPEELGIDAKNAAKIQEIKRLRPLTPSQPWGIFFVKFEPKRLPVVALRRILGQVALKKRASANKSERQAWAADDLLFVSNYGEGEERQISFAHFSRAQDGHDLPTLKVLGWDNRDTVLHLDAVARELSEHLAWPDDDANAEAWRAQWRAAFTLRHREVITTSKVLSERLAELARAIRDRIKTALGIETATGPLTRLMKAFQTSLVHDLDEAGFADMYAQTIAYGLLSARITDSSRRTADDFAAHMRTNPFLRELMEAFLHVGGRRGKAGGPGIDFDELGVSEVVDLLDQAKMEAVVRDFGDRNPQEDPVIHFYEHFLAAYDKKQKVSRGVFYTPRPVVSYIVRSVDELLRTEFGLADGLADTTTWAEMAKRHKDLKIPEGISPDQDFVQILDPATGTGTFLVEVIDLIHKTLAARWKAQGHGEKKIDALWNEYVPKHLLTRLHGYELLMAPYAIAHLKIGLRLYETGYRFASDERARIYLTNALEPAQDLSETFELVLPALAHEATAVNAVKHKQRFTVIIGNPPYAGHSSNRGRWISRLVRDYYVIDGVPLNESNTKWLQDDYVKFFRLSQHLLATSGRGVLGLITNHGFIDNPTFRGMRKSLRDTFQGARVLDLHGNSKRKERAPGGALDENVFDIQQGVAIMVGVVGGGNKTLQHAHLYGTREAKCALLRSGSVLATTWHVVPGTTQFHLFRPQNNELGAEYQQFVSLNVAMPVHSLGIVTARDRLCIHFTIDEAWQTVVEFASMKPEAARTRFALGPDTRDWQVKLAQRDLIESGLQRDHIRRIYYRPFDWRWTYYTGQSRGFHCMPRGEVMRHMLTSPSFGLSTTRSVESGEFSHVSCANALIGHHCVSLKEVNYLFPLWLTPGEGELQTGVRPNMSSVASQQFGKEVLPEAVSQYVYAVLHSPAYRSRYAQFLKMDFPRLPLSMNIELLQTLGMLGGELTALHLMESSKLDHFITTYTGPKNPEVGRVGWSEDTVWLDAAATKKGQPAKPGTIGFHGVRESVWNFHIGGYQVCDKWLKDRKGRTLSDEDIAHYQKIVVALSETIRIMAEIDEVIEQHGGWPGAFQTGEVKAAAAKVLPFRPRTVEPKPEERYVTCVPLVPLKAAAGAFSDPQNIDNDGFEWAAVETRRRLRPGMFVAQVVGRSMEPAIPDGSWCLFAAPVEGTRQGKTVLVQLRHATDPENGQRYTVKRYESEKSGDGDLWRHERITLKPVNPEFEPIVLTGADEGEFTVVAELVEVLRSDS